MSHVSQLRRILPLVGFTWRASRKLSLLVSSMLLVRSALPVIFIWVSGQLVGAIPAAVEGGLASAGGRRMLTMTVIASAIFVLQQTLGPLSDAMERALARRTDAQIRHEVIDVFGGTPGLAHLEDPSLQDLAQAAKGVTASDVTPGLGVMGISVYVRRLLTLAGTFWITLRYGWLVPTVLLAAWLGARAWVRRDIMKIADVMMGKTRELRRSLYFRDVSLQPGVAKEIRIFGTAGWFSGRFDDEWLSGMKLVWRQRAKSMVPLVGISLVLGGAHVWAIWMIGRDVLAGELGLEAIAVLVPALLNFEIAMNIDQNDMFLANALPAVDLLAGAGERIREHPAVVPAGGGRVSPDAPALSLRFEDVTFSYPGNPNPVYRGLDLDVPVGGSLAIVGPNGAGKTTLVKLLARLYDPDSGRITVDGVDLRSLDAAAWQRRIGAIFQDFVQYPLTARENIALGSRDDVEIPDEVVRRAISLAGAEPVIEGFPDGLDTVLTRSFDQGIDPSGGQWQRLALARALVAVEMGAGVLVLDEPTANLDVRAEAELFDRFLDLTEGLTTILISHRFSTVRRADRICVLENGRITEQGTHEELVSLGGTYARMFEVQAARFRDDGPPDDDPPASDPVEVSA